MTESNTPAENQKKKSAFSRFFSRKKNKPEDVKPAPVENLNEQINDTTSQASDNGSQTLAQDTSTITSSVDSNETPIDSAIVTQQPDSIELDTSTANITQDEIQSSAPTVTTSETSKDNTEKPSTVEPLHVNENRSTGSTELIDNSSSNKETLDDNSATSDTKITPETSATVEDGLTKSRSSFLQKISNVFKGSFNLGDELFDELEELLITSDIGVDTSLSLVEKLRDRVKKEKIQDANGVIAGLRQEISLSLAQSEQEWSLAKKPYVIMMVGINGAGKTTTTAKIAKYFQDQGKTVMLAAADTFRAAAVEQLQEWGRRLDIPVIAQANGSDAAAVAHDALTSAIARDIDVLMIDTAGRLHTQSDLMAQLEKVNRVLAKIDPKTPHEVMQILDAGTGQNALTQLEHFQKAVGVSSICLTKLDGSAKGGIAISLSEKYKLPIRFIGVGEGFNDLKRFTATQFADALIPDLKK